MTTSNRAITAEFKPSEQKITLEVLRATKSTGTLQAGDTMQVSKSEARRLLQINKDVYRIKMD